MSTNIIKGYCVAIQPIFTKILKILILPYLSSFPSKKNIFYDYFSHSAQELQVKISNNKNYESDLFFYSFRIFHENHTILHCFYRRYEFCMQNYLCEGIFYEFAGKSQFPPILSKAIALQFSRFSQKFEKF